MTLVTLVEHDRLECCPAVGVGNGSIRWGSQEFTVNNYKKLRMLDRGIAY